MEVMSGTRSSSSSSSSTLNPNAPMFVPLAYRTVEDFSDQWWELVHSSPWFRDYWLRERFQDPQNNQNDTCFSDFDFELDEDALFHDLHQLVSRKLFHIYIYIYIYIYSQMFLRNMMVIR